MPDDLVLIDLDIPTLAGYRNFVSCWLNRDSGLAYAVVSKDDLIAAGIMPIPTPGHAPHHTSSLHNETLFVGEAAGTFTDLGQGRWSMRPATPLKFNLESAPCGFLPKRIGALSCWPACLRMYAGVKKASRGSRWRLSSSTRC